jgi:hypothetical protein
MPRKKIQKKSPSKKAETKTKKTKPTKTSRDKKIEEYCDWVTDKEFPMQFRNQFPTWIDDVDKYLETLKVSSEQYEPSFELEEDTKLFQAYRYGYAVGFYEGVTQVLERIKEVKQESTEQEPEIDLKFNQWWEEQHDQNKFSDGKMTFDTLDKYSVISYGTDLGVKFEKFSEFIKEYCWSRKRVGFWRTDEYGNHTFHFDVKNQEELDERNKEFRIKKAKELLETEGIIEPIEPDYSKGI